MIPGVEGMARRVEGRVRKLTNIEHHDADDEKVNKDTARALSTKARQPTASVSRERGRARTPLLRAEPEPTKKPAPMDPPMAIMFRWRVFMGRSSSVVPRPYWAFLNDSRLRPLRVYQSPERKAGDVASLEMTWVVPSYVGKPEPFSPSTGTASWGSSLEDMMGGGGEGEGGALY